MLLVEFYAVCVNDRGPIPILPAGIDYGQFPDSGVGFIHIILGEESLVGAGIVILDDNIVEYNENFTVRSELCVVNLLYQLNISPHTILKNYVPINP